MPFAFSPAGVKGSGETFSVKIEPAPENEHVPCRPRQKPSFSVTALAEHPPRHFAVVEFDYAVPQHLGSFMALARQEHDIAGTRLIERDFNGALPIGLHQEFRFGALYTDNRVVDDEQWILAARIVRSKHDDVARTPRRLSH